MNVTLLKNAIIITPSAILKRGWLTIADGRIQDFGTGTLPSAEQVIDCDKGYLLAGFIDVHVHGSIGHDVMDADPDTLLEMSAFFASHGVTSWLPTTLTDSHENIMQALQAIKIAMSQQTTGATILGAHLEGPYLNPDKCGAQDSRYIRRANMSEIEDILAVDVVKLASVAPEYNENLQAINRLSQGGVVVSAAHTNATFDQMQAGIERGITHSTHTFNAMPKLHHREPGGLTALLLNDAVFCEIIADGVHVHPQMINLLLRTKGTERVILITDAMRATGIPAGNYTLGGHSVQVDGERATLQDGTLAGSILTMDVALKNIISYTGQSLENIWQLSSANVAQSLGFYNRGTIARGKQADLVLLNAEYIVQKTFVSGDCVYSV